MTSIEEAKRLAALTYNAASDHYDHPANAFWARYGARTIQRLGLNPGDKVFDACCGTGASAIPAAAAVGQSGLVLGVDLAENLLQLARWKARNAGLRNVEFVCGDILQARGHGQFDAVVCVFGLFFVPDMNDAARRLWTMVKPGGRLAITTWGPRFLEPASTSFWNSVRGERADLYKGFNPWDRISEPDDLQSILSFADLSGVVVAAERGSQELRQPEDWWPMVLGTGYRGTIEQLDIEARTRVRHDCLNFIRTFAVSAVETNVIYAIASKAREI